MSKNHFSFNKSLVLASTLLVVSTSLYGLEFHPGYDRQNPPPKGYWYSNMASSYNPWTDDIKMDLLTFPASNKGVTRYQDIKMLPEGHTFGYGHNGPKVKDGGTWEFVDLSSKTLSGTNWVHGNNYTYPKDSWALQINGEGEFAAYRPAINDKGEENSFELNAYRGIAVEVSNLGDTYLTIFSPVEPNNKGMRQWLGKKHRAYIGLEPGDTDILYFPFIRDKDKVSQDALDYFGCIHHLCGYPGGHLYGQVYSQIGSVSGAWGIRAEVPAGVKKGNVKWTINRMWAGGKYQVPTKAEIQAAGHTEEKFDDKNWVDEYGQWKYDDWVGKVWNEEDAKKQYDHLKEYVENNPAPLEWNKYGGWANGPKLSATGYFYVTKYNSKWWFVDPLGNLFLSQGALHMSANTPKTAAQAGYTDANYPDEIYFPRLRSMGLNSVGGNSSWKWHKGKMPYTYQVKSGLAPISEADITAKGGIEGFEAYLEKVVYWGKAYAADPYCIGFVVDNELKISGGDTMTKLEVEEVYFRAVRKAIDKLSAEVGRPEPMIMFDPSSNGGEPMAKYCDVLSMHRMEGFTPATWNGKFNSLGNWGIDRPVGQFTFTMGNLDVGLAHFGLTMFLNQRNRAQGMANFMRMAYKHPNNIACHIYSYGKWKARPLTEYRMVTNISNSTDYWLMKYLNKVGTDMYYLHMGLEVPDTLAPDNDNDGIPDLKDDDDDNDGIKDRDEVQYGLNPYVAADADEDNDGDGISNRDEINGGASPNDEKYILKVQNEASDAYEQNSEYAVTLSNGTKVTAKITKDQMLELSLVKDGKTTSVKIIEVGAVLEISKDGAMTLTLSTNKKIVFAFQNGGEVSSEFEGVVLPLSVLPEGTKIEIDGKKIRSTVTIIDKVQF